MKINVYLPDEIGQRAKDADINLSGLLRYAVEEELTNRDAMEELLSEPHDYELNAVDDQGRTYIAQFTGAKLANTGSTNAEVYLTEDNELIVRDIDQDGRIVHLEEPEDLAQWLDETDYIETMHALGETPKVRI